MRTFSRYLVSFSITHLFFVVFLFFGLGIFSGIKEEHSSFVYQYIVYLCIVATVAQSLFFTLLSRYMRISGLSFFITALVIELVVSNSLFTAFIHNEGYIYQIKDSILINVCLVAGLVISLVIKEYHADEPL